MTRLRRELLTMPGHGPGIIGSSLRSCYSTLNLAGHNKPPLTDKGGCDMLTLSVSYCLDNNMVSHTRHHVNPRAAGGRAPPLRGTPPPSTRGLLRVSVQ